MTAAAIDTGADITAVLSGRQKRPFITARVSRQPSLSHNHNLFVVVYRRERI